jgi:hypothetical protein
VEAKHHKTAKNRQFIRPREGARKTGLISMERRRYVKPAPFKLNWS